MMVKVTKLGYFIGEFWHNLTERNRLALPKRIRIEIDGIDVILTQGDEGCVVGYTRAAWAEMVKQPLSIPNYEEQGRWLRRKLFSQALLVELDSQGRLVLPDKLLNWTGLKGRVGEEVAIIGAGDHFEIWQKDVWHEYSRKLENKNLLNKSI